MSYDGIGRAIDGNRDGKPGGNFQANLRDPDNRRPCSAPIEEVGAVKSPIIPPDLHPSSRGVSHAPTSPPPPFGSCKASPASSRRWNRTRVLDASYQLARRRVPGTRLVRIIGQITANNRLVQGVPSIDRLYSANRPLNADQRGTDPRRRASWCEGSSMRAQLQHLDDAGDTKRKPSGSGSFVGHKRSLGMLILDVG